MMLDDTDGKRAILYAIQCEQYTKIGFTMNPVSRMRILAMHNPFPLRVVFSRSISPQYKVIIERAVHRQLEAYWHRGEWYVVDVATIKKAFAEAMKVARARRRADLDWQERAIERHRAKTPKRGGDVDSDTSHAQAAD